MILFILLELIHYEDRLGKLNISDEGIKIRDQIVISTLPKIPLCGVLGGGYNKNFNKLIELHSMLHKSCAEIKYSLMTKNPNLTAEQKIIFI